MPPQSKILVTKVRSADPLHGVTLKAIVAQLVEKYGWKELGRRIPVNCFTKDPSVGSSLKFLRKTPWARTNVEQLYLDSQSLPQAEGSRPSVYEPSRTKKREASP